jgi:hypothetical protein
MPDTTNTETETETVSCLMVTQPGRMSLVLEAIRDFVYQDHHPRRRRLILVAACKADAATEEDFLECRRQFSVAIWDELETRREYAGALRILVHNEPGSPSLGAMRNFANRDAYDTGYRLQFDDDDRHHPSRISCQLAALRDGDHVACCLTQQLYFFTQTNELYWVDWRNRAPRYRSILIPGTILVRSDVADFCRYPEAGPESIRGEDGHYLNQVLRHGTVAECDIGELYLRRFHGANTWGEDRFRKNATWLGLTRGQLLAEDRRGRLERAFALGRWAEPGVTIKVMGKDGPAYTFEVQGRTDDGSPS